MSQSEPGPSLSSSRPDTATSAFRDADESQPEQSIQSESLAGAEAPAPTTDVTAQQARLPPLASLTASAGQRRTVHPAFQSLLNAAASSSTDGEAQALPQAVTDGSIGLGDSAKAIQTQQALPGSRQSAQALSQQHQHQRHYQQPAETQKSHGQHAETRPKQSPGLVSESSEPTVGSYIAATGGTSGYAPSQAYASRLPQPASIATPSAPPSYQRQPPPLRYTPMPPPVAASTQSPAFETPFRFPQGQEMQQTRPRSPHYHSASVPREVAPPSTSPERQTAGHYGSEPSPGGYSYGDTQGMSFQIDVQGASRVADEKRRRNAGASARFRARRKEREQQNSREIDDLKRKIRELEEDSDFYRRERDYFVAVLYNDPERDRHFPRPPSPRRLRIRHGTEESYGTYEEQGQRGGEDRSTRRRLTGEYHANLQESSTSGRTEVQRQPQQQQQYAPSSQYGPPPPPAPQSQMQYAPPPPPSLGTQQQYYYASSQAQPQSSPQGPSYPSAAPYGPPPQNRPPPPPPPASSGQAITSQHNYPSHNTPTHPGSGLVPWTPSQPNKRPA